jgi:hypothetical protein
MQSWQIKSRASACSVTERPFEEDEVIQTYLFPGEEGYERLDVNEEGRHRLEESGRLGEAFSSWKSRYEPPPPPEPETVPREGAEGLLRQLVETNEPQDREARYVLALMLERKRLLKEVDRQESAEGGEESEQLLVYEHAKTGEVFVIADPGLRLDELAEVQDRVSALLKERLGAK